MQQLESSLKAVQIEADKVPTLQAELAELQKSSVEDKQIAIDNVTSELNSKHERDLASIKSTREAEQRSLQESHEKATSELKSRHAEEFAALEDVSIQGELRRIKADFENAKTEAAKLAATQATNDTRAIMADEIRSLQSAHTAERAKLQTDHQKQLDQIKVASEKTQKKALDDATAQLKFEHQKEMEAAIEKQREEIQNKASGEMKTLSDAHSEKTASLESRITAAQEAERAAEEKAGRATELEHQLHVQNKELSDAKAELESAKQKLADLETKYDQLSLAYFETG